MKLARLFPIVHRIGRFLIAACALWPLGTLISQETRSTNKKVISPTPPMGWNSWDSYGLRINEKEFRDNVEMLDAKLKPFRYSYAVIDEG